MTPIELERASIERRIDACVDGAEKARAAGLLRTAGRWLDQAFRLNAILRRFDAAQVRIATLAAAHETGAHVGRGGEA